MRTAAAAALKLVNEIYARLDENPSAVPQWVAQEVCKIMAMERREKRK